MRTSARSIAVILLASVAVVFPASTTTGAPPTTTAKVCHRGTPARIGGEQKCLQAGEYCAARYQRQYEHYGYECSTSYRPPRLRRW